jgi:hypothetical protein
VSEHEDDSTTDDVELLVELEPVSSAKLRPKTSDVINIAMTRAEFERRSTP